MMEEILDMKNMPNSMFGFKFDQIAIHTPRPQVMMDALSGLGANEWVHDRVEAFGEVNGRHCSNVAELHFNYQMAEGVEFEILNYIEGDNWLRGRGSDVGLSHMGIHVDNLERAMEQIDNYGLRVIQRVVTRSHTNEAIKDNRRYEYVIYDTFDDFGFDIKLIKRMSL